MEGVIEDVLWVFEGLGDAVVLTLALNKLDLMLFGLMNLTQIYMRHIDRTILIRP